MNPSNIHNVGPIDKRRDTNNSSQGHYLGYYPSGNNNKIIYFIPTITLYKGNWYLRLCVIRQSRRRRGSDLRHLWIICVLILRRNRLIEINQRRQLQLQLCSYSVSLDSSLLLADALIVFINYKDILYSAVLFGHFNLIEAITSFTNVCLCCRTCRRFFFSFCCSWFSKKSHWMEVWPLDKAPSEYNKRIEFYTIHHPHCTHLCHAVSS